MKPMRSASDPGPFENALVLGGGGMFGAYQAGAWLSMHEFFRPDLVIGASIGAVNGWAIAGGCEPGQWAADWLDPPAGALPGFRFPRSPLDGFVDRAAFERFFQSHHQRFTPRVPFAAVLTDLLRLEPFPVLTPHVTWRHLAASCAVPLVLPQYRLDGRLVSDGGLLAALPVWAAVRMGARRIVGVNIMPRVAPYWLRFGRAILRRLSRFDPAVPALARIVVVEPDPALGPLRETVRWSRDNAGRWIEAGRRDAAAARGAIKTI